jgi:UDP-GlcNAc:undecaprenyl-phosphate GlcNAc-1-phosphate transferase
MEEKHMSMIWPFLLFSCLISYVVIPQFRKIAIRTEFVDRPNNRKTQKRPLPMLGGLGMVLVFVLITLVASQMMQMLQQQIIGMLIGILILTIAGLVDDYAKTRGKDFPAFPKFLAQIAATYMLILSGTVIHGMNIPIGPVHHIEFSPWLGQLITILWVVGVINAFNFLDGIDGLAGGIAAISGTSLMFIALIMGQQMEAILATILVGTALGYLRHNFFPAKIIMGDTGSMFLGYVLGAISVLGAFKSVTLVSVLVPILALGLPIFDAIYVVVRRMIQRKPIYAADRTHAHHRLMNTGLTQKQAVTFLYLIGTCFGMVSLVITLLEK